MVDQQLHGIHAITGRGGDWTDPAIVVARQHKVIHPADPAQTVAQTHRHTRAKHGDDDQVTLGDKVFAGQDLHCIAVELTIKVSGWSQRTDEIEFHPQRPLNAGRYTVRSMSLTRWVACTKLSECPAKNSPSGRSRCTMRSSILFWVALSK